MKQLRSPRTNKSRISLPFHDVGSLLIETYSRLRGSSSVWVPKITHLRNQIVRSAKASEKYRRFAEDNQRTGPKYWDPNDLAQSGAASVEDCLFLYLLVRSYRPSAIAELGTWFGTTAAVMVQALMDNNTAGVVYTCDKHDVYCPLELYSKSIKIHCKHSSEFFKEITPRTIDFAFLDGRLAPGDAKRFVRLFKGRVRVAVHDCRERKGLYNLAMLNKSVHKASIFVPRRSRKPYLLDGVPINAGTALFLADQTAER